MTTNQPTPADILKTLERMREWLRISSDWNFEEAQLEGDYERGEMTKWYELTDEIVMAEEKVKWQQATIEKQRDALKKLSTHDEDCRSINARTIFFAPKCNCKFSIAQQALEPIPFPLPDEQ